MTLCILCRGEGGGRRGRERREREGVEEGDEKKERSGEEDRRNHIPFNAQQKSLNTSFVPLLTLV